MSHVKEVVAIFRRREAHGGIDEVRVYSFPEWPYCFAERVGDTANSTPKLDFMELAQMLTFCGYVRQDSP
jgi:hypothetical protein